MKGIEVFITPQKLEPYNSKRNCPKCGCAFIETNYNHQHDVMVRKCPCGYTWREAPLDQKDRQS